MGISKILKDLCHKKKKIFCKTCLQCFSGKIVLIEHKKIA